VVALAVRKRYFLPVWFAATVVMFPKPRFLMLVGAFVVAAVVFDWLPSIGEAASKRDGISTDGGRLPRVSLVLLLLLSTYGVATGGLYAANYGPVPERPLHRLQQDPLPSYIDGDDVAGTGPQQHVGEAAGRSADVEGAPVLDAQPERCERLQGSGELVAAAGDVLGCGVGVLADDDGRAGGHLCGGLGGGRTADGHPPGGDQPGRVVAGARQVAAHQFRVEALALRAGHSHVGVSSYCSCRSRSASVSRRPRCTSSYTSR